MNDNCYAGSADCNCATYDIEDVGGGHRIIRNPGKFEGQTPAVVHFWNIGLEGFADSDDGHAYKFRLRSTDKDVFPELGRATWLTLIEDDQGFVSGS